MEFLNVGCGYRYHQDWVNVDFVSTGPGVAAHNLVEGIPYETERFDVVYHSHVIEHFTKTGALSFLRECHRVLKRGGILRIAFPDLEQIARNYCKLLDEFSMGNFQRKDDYDWTLLELYDQTVRNDSGGEMLKFFARKEIPNLGFVLSRCGVEARNLVDAGRQILEAGKKSDPPKSSSRSRRSGLRSELIKALLRGRAQDVSRIKLDIKEERIRKILGPEYRLLELGRFRTRGEIHQWMYDWHSLSQSLQDLGFSSVIRQSAKTSLVPSWTSFNLDTEPDGTTYKPDSGFLEATK